MFARLSGNISFILFNVRELNLTFFAEGVSPTKALNSNAYSNNVSSRRIASSNLAWFSCSRFQPKFIFFQHSKAVVMKARKTKIWSQRNQHFIQSALDETKFHVFRLAVDTDFRKSCFQRKIIKRNSLNKKFFSNGILLSSLYTHLWAKGISSFKVKFHEVLLLYILR